MKVGDLVKYSYACDGWKGCGIVLAAENYSGNCRRYYIYWPQKPFHPILREKTWESPKDLEVVSASR